MTTPLAAPTGGALGLSAEPGGCWRAGRAEARSGRRRRGRAQGEVRWLIQSPQPPARSAARRRDAALRPGSAHPSSRVARQPRSARDFGSAPPQWRRLALSESVLGTSPARASGRHLPRRRPRPTAAQLGWNGVLSPAPRSRPAEKHGRLWSGTPSLLSAPAMGKLASAASPQPGWRAPQRARGSWSSAPWLQRRRLLLSPAASQRGSTLGSDPSGASSPGTARQSSCCALPQLGRPLFAVAPGDRALSLERARALGRRYCLLLHALAGRGGVERIEREG